MTAEDTHADRAPAVGVGPAGEATAEGCGPSAQAAAHGRPPTLSQRLFRVAELARADFAETVGRHGLTPVQARALLMLEEPVPMSAVAGRLACDASNVTGLADRLEALGVAERVPSSDRRVKLLRFTDRGAALRDELARELARGSAVTDRLTVAEREQLTALLDKMLTSDG